MQITTIVWLVCTITIPSNLCAPLAPITTLPQLCVFTNNITVSGISSGADFVVQFAVAYSSVVTGVGVFAGEPFGCAVLKFPADPEQTCSEQPATEKGPGCVAAKGDTPAPCIGCSANKTLLYDHCKINSKFISDSMLLTYVLQSASNHVIDDVSNLKRMKVYLYRGALDPIYEKATVVAVGKFFRNFIDPTQILEEYSIPSLHAWPTNNFGTPCGIAGPMLMENCNYDGSGIMISKISQSPLLPPAKIPMGTMYSFDQTLFFPTRFPGLAQTGYIYIPNSCLKPKVQCSLHVMFHGCTMYAENPPMGLNFTQFNGINSWADSNNIIVLYPQSGGYVNQKELNPTAQELMGCYDSFGQISEDFSFKTGPQLESVSRMIRAMSCS